MTIFNGYRGTFIASAAAAESDEARLESLIRYLLRDPADVDPKVVDQVFGIIGIPSAAALLKQG